MGTLRVACDNFSGITFPWTGRPWNLPLPDFEIGLAFKMVGIEDLNKVAKVLKVSIDRLESALERFSEWRALSRRRQRERERNQQRERDENSPVSARFEGATLIVTVKKPRFRQRIEAGANEEGDFEIRFTREDDKYRDVVKRAKEIAGENGPSYRPDRFSFDPVTGPQRSAATGLVIAIMRQDPIIVWLAAALGG